LGQTEKAAVVQSATAQPAARERKILYYRNPMGLPDTSPAPKKDQMGMQYIPVYEGEEAPGAAPGQVQISTEKIQKLGVRTEPVELREVDRVVRAVAKADVNERYIFGISPKFEGWIEKVYANTIYQQIKKGDPLFEVYSPELLSAQEEYVIAAEGMDSLKDASPETQANMKRLAESALIRLRNWGISEQLIQQLKNTRKVRRTLTITAPAAGYVVDKKMVFPGMAFKPGQEIYTMADLLTSVWVIAEVFEQDMDLLKIGQPAKVVFTARPGQEFPARIDYIYPVLNAMTRTAQVRLEVKNPTAQIFGAMYADVRFDVGQGKGKVVTVPKSAVISSGTRNVVLVQLAEGRFEPHEVSIGIEGENYVEVTKGVGVGETVVTAANFLIDSESSLKAAFAGFAPPGPGRARPDDEKGQSPSMQHSMTPAQRAEQRDHDAMSQAQPAESMKQGSAGGHAGMNHAMPAPDQQAPAAHAGR
jgi:Cu(I)/Ag(I) efflux system membrane fusion protein